MYKKFQDNLMKFFEKYGIDQFLTTLEPLMTTATASR